MPTPDTELPVGIVVAVREELQAILRKMPLADVDSVSGVSFYRGAPGGRPVVLAKSGMGAERTRVLTERLIERYAPCVLLIAGFAAALTEEVAPGDLVVADKVASLPNPLAPFPDSLAALAGKGETEQAALWLPSPSQGEGPGVRVAGGEGEPLRQVKSIAVPGARCHLGGLLTAARIAPTAAEKRDLADRTPDCIALDMETAGAATAAESAGVPWLAVRAITDGLHDDLPLAFDRFVGADGEVSRLRIAVATLIRPWKIPAMLRLGAHASRAARNLAAFVEQYVEAMQAGRAR